MRLQVPVEKKPVQSAATLRHGSQREQPSQLSIGPVNDSYEDEASRVAEEVLRRPGLPPTSATSPGRPDSSESSVHSPEVEPMIVSPGQPLDRETRAFMETRFGYDFSRVRVHADEEAAQSAREMAARAYTLDQHIVFGQGQFSPATSAGRKLLAHELVHTIQQSDAAPHPGLPQVSRASRKSVMRESLIGQTNYRFDTFNMTGDDLSDPDFRERLDALSVEQLFEYLDQTQDQAVINYVSDLLPRRMGDTPSPELVHLRDSLKNPAYQAMINNYLSKPHHPWGKEYSIKTKTPPEEALAKARKNAKDITSTTSMNIAGDIPAPKEITIESLKKIFPAFANDIDTDPDKLAKAKTYVENLNSAFKLMKIDTIQAQANYLAHAYAESAQFRAFTESQSVTKPSQLWVDDPSQVHLSKDIGMEEDKATKTKRLSENYQEGKDINPGGKMEFVGRGPVQVTGRTNYRIVIAQLDQAAEFYLKQNDTAGYLAAREAANAIAANPKNAADPKYTFLASAALMKYMEGDRKVGGKGPKADFKASSWVGGVAAFKKDSPQDKALQQKSQAYTKAFCVLLEQAKAENPNLQVPDTANKDCGSAAASAGKKTY